jgi:Domain of unknown function (DUF4145)
MPATTRRTFLVCTRCTQATIHSLLNFEESDFKSCSADGFVSHEPATYHFFRCDGCTQISVYIWSALHSPYSEFGELIYPRRFIDGITLPDSVKVAYVEAEKIRPHSVTAYAVLSRKVLEVIANERGINERNLSRALEVLAATNQIPPVLAEAATLIRVFGNVGAHSGGGELNGLHAEMIGQFLELIVQYVYEAPAALHNFKCLLGLDDDGTD